MRNLIATVFALGILAIASPAFAQEAPCHDPYDLGARPDDGIVDNVPFQGAIIMAAYDGKPVCVGPGVYEFESLADRLDLGTPRRLYALVATGGAHTVTIRGAGMYSTTLKAVGDWHGSDGILLGAYDQRGFYVEHLRVDMSGRVGLAEQQHGIQLGYNNQVSNRLGVKGFGIRNVSFYHPELGPNGGGDCIRMVGGYTPGELIEGGYIENIIGEACDRSTISFQRSVRYVNIVNVLSQNVVDQDLDMEATGIVTDEQRIVDVWVRGFTAIRQHGGTSISLGRGSGIRFESSKVVKGTVLIQSCSGCSMRDTVIQGPDTSIGIIGIRRVSEGMFLSNVTVTKPAGSSNPGNLIQVSAVKEGTKLDVPKRVVLDNVYMVQPNADVALSVLSSQVDMRGGVVEFTGARTPNAVAVTFYSTVPGAVARGSVDGVEFRGPWSVAVKAGVGIGRVRVTRNESEATNTGLLCETATGGAVVTGGNLFEKSPGVLSGSACPQAVTGS